ncbi:MAG: erythromycin esterase family protein [Actinomycetota bacterium]
MGIFFDMVDDIEAISYPIESESDLDPLIDQAGGKRAVLIGGATHGTNEFYTWRAKITQKLIEEKGFSFVAVEGNWPACYQINQYVKSPASFEGSLEDGALQALNSFNSWPTWLWANNEVLSFIEWLAEYNQELPDGKKVGFFGLDIYSLWESLSAAVKYLEDTIPEAADVARQVYRCFKPQQQDIDKHKWITARLSEPCKKEIAKFLSTLNHLPPAGKEISMDDKFNAEQSALIAVSAEHYYRIMLRGDPDAWNLREEHMANTFFRLREFHSRGFEAKGIIWAHNIHVGDARASEMAKRNEFSIGQLARDRFGDLETYLIGFGTYQGDVIAADDWEAPSKKMPLPPAVYESWEHVFHGLSQKDRMLIFPSNREKVSSLLTINGHRAIGAVYDPDAEFSNYVQVALANLYDSFLFIDKTSALSPFNIKPKSKEPPQTFPFAA